MHVIHPSVGFLLSAGPVVALAVGLLLWSLLGVRVDARRGLQAALASHPPKVPGGPAACRECGGDLVVEGGALGATCRYCGADNLVKLPASWVTGAREAAKTLKVTAEAARAQEAEGHRRMWRAAAWRVPLAMVFVGLICAGAWRGRGGATWADLHSGALYEQMMKRDGDVSVHLRSLPSCDDARARHALASDSVIRIGDEAFCEGRFCRTMTLLPLARGETLRLAWSSPPSEARMRLAIGDQDYTAGFFGEEGFGDTLAAESIPAKPAGTTFFTRQVQTTGYYWLGVNGAKGVALDPCVAR
jgi:hypothetical protein